MKNHLSKQKFGIEPVDVEDQIAWFIENGLVLTD